MYDWLKLIHVLAVIVWVGGSVLVAMLMPRLLGSGDRGARLAAVRTAELAGRVFMVAAILALAVGVWMVLDNSSIEFSQAWISIGFLGIALGAVLGGAFYSPTTRKMLAAVEAGDERALAVLGKRIGTVSLGEIVALVIVVWAMVFKPGL